MEKDVIEVNEEITVVSATEAEGDTGNQTDMAEDANMEDCAAQGDAEAYAPGAPEEGPEAERIDAPSMDDSKEDNEADISEAEVERLIAEAEARGYERGRNENIEAWMNEGRSGRQNVSHEVAENEIMILNNMRRSVWE